MTGEVVRGGESEGRSEGNKKDKGRRSLALEMRSGVRRVVRERISFFSSVLCDHVLQ